MKPGEPSGAQEARQPVVALGETETVPFNRSGTSPPGSGEQVSALSLVGSPAHSTSPQIQRGFLGNSVEVAVSRQKRKPVANAKLGDEGIDGAYLEAAAATAVPEARRFDMIFDRRDDHRQHREKTHNTIPRSRTSEPLQ
jgi:hypothetical protein